MHAGLVLNGWAWSPPGPQVVGPWQQSLKENDGEALRSQRMVREATWFALGTLACLGVGSVVLVPSFGLVTASRL